MYERTLSPSKGAKGFRASKGAKEENYIESREIEFFGFIN